MGDLYGEDELLEALKLLAQSGKIGLIIVTYPRGMDFMYELHFGGQASSG
ncbi:MAG: hypothetical protein QXD32_07600 [Nitrososphaerota archaeon]